MRRAGLTVVAVCTVAAVPIGGMSTRAEPLAADGRIPLLELHADIERGVDRGQNYGTLFELVDARGRVLAGAGFQSAYNTQPRYERQLLQAFVRDPDAAVGWEVERLPDIDSVATGFYPFSYDGRLLVHNRSEKGRRPADPRVQAWDPAAARWVGRDEAAPYAESVSGRLLEVTPTAVRLDGTVIAEPRPGAVFAEHYLAGGRLIVRELDRQAVPPRNELVAFTWPDRPAGPLARDDHATLPLPIENEFIYAFGQWRDEVLAVSNNGRVARCGEGGWDTLREPEPGVSYQVYAALTHRDRLLLGHYPTGEVWAYAGGALERLEGWPPRLPGVSPAAREAQTLAIYGGDLYAGVWPWGEVWRLDADRETWCLADRMFRHPQPSPATIHPYEKETARVDPVGNLWGQRITGLYPLGEWLYITTSSKGSGPWEEKFDFLTPRQRADYGAVHRARVPGVLTVPIDWTEGPTRLAIRIDTDRLSILQDGRLLGVVHLPSSVVAGFEPVAIRWGEGVFGPAVMQIVDPHAAWSSAVGPHPWRATYLHLERLVPPPPTTSPADLESRVDAVVAAAHAAGINTLLPYATGSRGQAFYPSGLGGETPYGEADPVGLVVRAARRRGMAVYPVVCLTVCGHETPTGILETHPDWGLRHPDGSPLGYISPAQPAARAWLASRVAELTRRFRPDGVVLDYVRFHNRPLRLDEAAERRFEAGLPADVTPEDRAARFQRFKEDELTELVTGVSRAIRAAVPGTRVAAYCWGPGTLSNHLTAQVWDRWVEAGLVDLVNISGYFHHAKYGDDYMRRFEKQLAEVLRVDRSLPRRARMTFALGVSTSHGDVRSADDIRGYLRAAETAGMDGVAFFSWHTLVPYLTALEAGGDIGGAFAPPAAGNVDTRP